MTKYMFIINGKRAVVYSEDIYVGGKFDHQRVYTRKEEHLRTFNSGESVQNVFTFVKSVDPNYGRAEIFYLTFPCIETKHGNYTLDMKKKIPNLAYQKPVFDTDDITTEEFHYLIERYNTMKGAVSTFIHNVESKRIIQ